MDISIVIPLLNEEESLSELTEWIVKVMKENNFSYEIVFVDDGSTDNSWRVIENLQKDNSNIKALKFRRNYGKAAGLHCGFKEAEGDVFITMDADLQDNPEEIPELFRLIKEENYDLVSGWKRKRYDPLISKNLPSKFYNWSARLVSGINLHDFNCGLKAYKRSVAKSIEIYGDMHRVIPILVKQAGFRKIGEKVVLHQKRKYGTTKYGIDRFIKGFLNLLTISVISKFGKSPMHFFGILGSFSFLLGFGILIYLSVEKLFFQVHQMTERPLFFLGVLSVIFGTQLFLTGFLAELISRNSAIRNDYQIETRI